MMQFANEDKFRKWLLEQLKDELPKYGWDVLESKNVTDVILLRTDAPLAVFIECKYYSETKNRINIGNNAPDFEKIGYQVEILMKRPPFFDLYTRWLIANDKGDCILATNCQIRQNISGGELKFGKQNNIQVGIFNRLDKFKISESPVKVIEWLNALS